MNMVYPDQPWRKRIEDNSMHCAYGYYSNQNWLDEEHIVLTRSAEMENFVNVQLVLVDITNGNEVLLSDTCKNYHDHVVADGRIYYLDKDELWCVNPDGTGKEAIFHCPNMTFPHTTYDGRYLNMQVQGEKDSCVVVDLHTGKHETVFSKSFEKPFSEADHMMICPTDPDTVFFAHEGTTFYVSNRLWVWERDRGMRCLAKQRLDSDGNLGDCFGHECWSADGKGLYFVKYPCSPMPPRGICYVGLNGNQTDVLYGAYPYWHVAASPDGRYLAADTQSGEYSAVCLVDMENGSEKLFAKAGYTWIHPCHPHPTFSPSGKKLCWHSIRNGKLGVEIAEIHKIP